MNKTKTVSFIEQYGSFSFMVACFAFFSFKIPDVWLTSYMFSTVLEQSVSLGFVALGLTVVMASGEMDMSIGSIVSLGSMLSMMAIAQDKPIWMAIVVTILCGAAVGLINGFMRTKMDLPGIIPTIGTQSAIAGVAMMVNSGNMIYGSGEFLSSYTRIGRGYLGAVPIAIMVFASGALIIWFFLSKTRSGRLFYMIGGNKTACLFSGIKVNKHIVKAYVVCAILGGMAGIMASARSGSGNPQAGVDLFLDGLIAVTLGSTIFAEEREYSAIGSVISAVFITMMINGLQLLGQGYHAQCIMRGLLLLISLTLSSLRNIRTGQ